MKKSGYSQDYFGEVAVHFCGGGQPLLVSISFETCDRLEACLQNDDPFVVFDSLSNQTVILRRKAISDLYFSDEACDTYGPEHPYPDFFDPFTNDDKHWAIIEEIGQEDQEGSTARNKKYEGVATKEVRAIKEIISSFGKEELDTPSIKNKLTAEQIEEVCARNIKQKELIFNCARQVTYQLSNGVRRHVEVYSVDDLYTGFNELVDAPARYSDSMIRFEDDFNEQTVFINKKAFDFITIPTHKYNQGQKNALIKGGIEGDATDELS